MTYICLICKKNLTNDLFCKECFEGLKYLKPCVGEYERYLELCEG